MGIYDKLRPKSGRGDRVTETGEGTDSAAELEASERRSSADPRLSEHPRRSADDESAEAVIDTDATPAAADGTKSLETTAIAHGGGDVSSSSALPVDESRPPHPTWSAAQLPEIAEPKEIKNVVPTLVIKKPGYRVPDLTVDTARVGAAWIAAASTRGPLHHDFRTTRQDAYLMTCTTDERWVVISVADGVGEAEYAHVAAEVVCREATEMVRNHLNDAGTPETVDWPAVIANCQVAIRKQSEHRINQEIAARVEQAELDRAIAKKVMSTTLQVAIVGSVPTGRGLSFVVAGLAGDGSAYTLNRRAAGRC